MCSLWMESAIIKERKVKMEKCVICKQEITADPFGWEGGCNAEPVESGQCCYDCDIKVVLPARLTQYGIKMEAE